MRIHVVYTGGTIGMIDSPHGLRPGADLEGWLGDQLKGTRLEALTVTSLEPLIDSANATPLSWQAVIDSLWEHHQEAEAFVVLHGTDTMAYTAAALSYALTDLQRPVVITGSQLPLGALGSDAGANVAGALYAATSGRARGVTLFFGDRLLAGNRSSKTSSWSYSGFSSPNTPALATTGAPWQWGPAPAAGTGWLRPEPYGRHDVVVVDMVPGMSASRLEALLSPSPEAVILRAFGVGNVAAEEPGLTEVVADSIGQGVPVIVASQCPQAEVLLGHYEAGDALARYGAVGAGDMTIEATYAKVQFLLAQGLRGAELATWVPRSIAGEVTEPGSH